MKRLNAPKVMFIEKMVQFIDPMQVELLSALAKQVGYETFFYTLQDYDIKKELQKIQPDIVALSLKTSGFGETMKCAQMVKHIHPKCTLVIGGPHPTFDQSVIEDPNVDVVIAGEADYAWKELLQALAAGRNIDGIKNVFTKNNWYGRFKVASEKGDQKAISAHLADRIVNLDDLPMLDFELVDRQVPHLAKFPMRTFMTSRGCPYECTYCFEPKFNQIYRNKGGAYQRYSPQRVVEELKRMISKRKTQFIKFYDDIFWIHNKLEQEPWLSEFANLYEKEIKIPFFVLTRCNILTEDHLKILKPAGLHSMTMSIEAADDYVRNKIIMRHMSKQDILHAFYLCDQYGIKTFANSILAIPVNKDKLKEMGKTNIEFDIESLDLNIFCKATYSEYTIIHPYAGTPFYEYAKDNGWYTEGALQKSHFSYQSWSPMENCFTDEEKIQQVNLSSLGTVCCIFPGMRNLVVNHLIKVKSPWVQKWIYHPMYFFAMGYLTMFKIYPMKLGIASFWHFFVRAWKNEIYKRSPGKNLYNKEVEKLPSLNTTPVTAKI